MKQKESKNMKQKFMQRPKEKGYEFVTRIMKGATSKREQLNAKQVHRLVDQRGSRKMNYAQVQSHLRYAAKKTGMIIIHKDKTVCPIRKRKVDTYSYNYTGIPNALVDRFIPPHTKHKSIDENVLNKMHEAHKKKELVTPHKKDLDEPFVDIGNWNFIKHDKKEPRDAVVSTVQHHFTAEQLLDTLNNLNPDLHDDVIVAIFDALGKNNYSPINYDSMLTGEPQPRKTALLSWAFVDGNLVVKE